MEGVRTAEEGGGSCRRDDPGSNSGRREVDGRSQALLGAPMAVCSGCAERDGGIGHGKRRSRTVRARLDALYFQLYDLSREDAEYILSTFPIVRREDEAQFGQYRTGDLILAYMNALASRDAESVIDL